MNEVQSNIMTLVNRTGTMFRRKADEMLGCDDAQDLMSPFIDSMASPDEVSRLKLHLSACESCQRQLQSFISVRSLLARIDHPVAPEDLVLDTRVKLSQARNKNYFAKLRAGVTCKDAKEEGKSSSNYVAMLNKLKNDMMNSKYYNSALDFKRGENLTVTSTSTSTTQSNNDFARAKPKTNNNNSNSLQLNSEQFVLGNKSNEISSHNKVQVLQHSQQDDIFKLSFSIIQKEQKQTSTKKEHQPEPVNTNTVSNEKQTMQSKTQQQPQQSQQDLQQQYNDYLREQYSNYMNMGNSQSQSQNKFNKSNSNQYPNNMYNNPYQESFGMDPQQMFSNPFFAQNSFYGMPFGYFPYSYGMPDSRNMFANMSGNVDPQAQQAMMMNMFTNYFMNFQQQQPNFYQNIPNEQNAFQQYHQNNVNFKK